eukprot:CAMPEP_0181366090 /NCGR_PEP_ID=MMETSP1106-20121128/10480_1 /TAXON_ID=81844 /ORGANISM="Mantoniella antarctica, Strain SL-175" /LENGTH=93 /DNA_ID=CAMNT_0023481339 /DNA_START=541 /DNA_END=822 /DNA_ORIENTATION=+
MSRRVTASGRTPDVGASGGVPGGGANNVRGFFPRLIFFTPLSWFKPIGFTMINSTPGYSTGICLTASAHASLIFRTSLGLPLPGNLAPPLLDA